MGPFCRGRTPPPPGCVPSGCLVARALVCPPPIAICCSAFFSSRARFSVFFKVLRNGLLQYILYHMSKPCDNVCVQDATEWTASVHTLSHVQACDNVCVQGATEWTASVHTLSHVQTCDSVRAKCYGMDCFCTHFTTCPNRPVVTVVFKVLRNGLLR